MQIAQHINAELYQGDIPEEFLNLARKIGLVAWDIETSGLDWRTEQLAVCQLYVPNHPVVVVQSCDCQPIRLPQLLADKDVKKIFHHAMFDLRFLVSNWQVVPQNIACTKIMAKLLDKDNTQKQTLQSLLKSHLNIVISKSQQRSNWFSSNLTTQQLDYAVKDVIFLPNLLIELEKEVKNRDLLSLTYSCFAHIPTRTLLDVLEYDDVYTY